ncbi:hypothetical protein GCM10007901_33960 [Dyella acidisoli]|uniref:Pyocin activator protein PrtN n=1 Tax=Dyella acidisoli TaxID=1867834 RepID=A0ABQ5XVU4_9GAMM|nr:hypothetical protein GCM10007901_33960 [Dyella acidisoli]
MQNKVSRQVTLSRINELEEQLLRLYGPLITGANLVKCLAYPSASALRQAACRGALPVPVVTIEGRRGRFACAKHVAAWLASTELSASYGEATAGIAAGNPS